MKPRLPRVLAVAGAALFAAVCFASGCATGKVADLPGDAGGGGDAGPSDAPSGTPCDAGCKAGEVCDKGVCSSSCAATENKCGNDCIDLLADDKNCGACAQACPQGLSCVAGKCTLKCTAPETPCDTADDAGVDAGLACVNPQTDDNNCGSCGTVCDAAIDHGQPGCVAGACGVGSCDQGWDDCNKQATDGCEADLTSDESNCGTCGTVCPSQTPVCVQGKCAATLCGNGVIDNGERCDGTLGVPAGNQITCRPGGSTNECKFDFSKVPQLYCNGSCTWAGGSGCDQADADLYCKLLTGNSASTAASFTTATAQATGGFPCWGGSYGTNLGTMPEYGVNIAVYYQSTSILANHGAGTIINSVTCN